MRTLRTTLTTLGLLAAGYGAWGLVTDLNGRSLRGWLRFWLGAAILHDALLAPLVLIAGWLVSRFVPPVARGPVQAGAVVTGILVLVEAPFVSGAGRKGDVPSALPLNYGRGLLLILAAIWLVVTGVILIRVTMRRRSHP